MKKGDAFILSDDYDRMVELCKSGETVFGVCKTTRGNSVACTILSDGDGIDMIGWPNIYIFFDQLPAGYHHFRGHSLLFFDYKPNITHYDPQATR